jgi:hypothetical protein
MKDFSSVRVGEQNFLFRGRIQRRIIDLLYQAWKSGHPKILTHTLLKQAQTKSPQIKHVFKGHPNWDQLVGYGNGYCWLKL